MIGRVGEPIRLVMSGYPSIYCLFAMNGAKWCLKSKMGNHIALCYLAENIVFSLILLVTIW